MKQLKDIDDTTPLAMLTVGQLRALLPVLSGRIASERTIGYVFGLDGICQLFGCGKSRAQVLKNTVIKDAVSQDGRTLVIDGDLAMRLFRESTHNARGKNNNR